MSKIIASAAIRGAHKIAGLAEERLKEAIDKFGPNQEVEFPNTGYYLPIIYAMTGVAAKNLTDMEGVLKKIKGLLPPFCRGGHTPSIPWLGLGCRHGYVMG